MQSLSLATPVSSYGVMPDPTIPTVRTDANLAEANALRNRIIRALGNDDNLRVISDIAPLIADYALPTPDQALFMEAYAELLRARRLSRVNLPPARFDQDIIRRITIVAVNQDGCQLRHASEPLHNDREVVLAAVRQDGCAFQYASEALRNEREVVLAAVTRSGLAPVRDHVGADLLATLPNDREIVLAAVRHDAGELIRASAALRGDREVVLAAVRRNGMALRHASANLRENRNFVLDVVKQDGWVLSQLSPALRGDREVVFAAARQNIRALDYTSAALRREFLAAAEQIVRDSSRSA